MTPWLLWSTAHVDGQMGQIRDLLSTPYWRVAPKYEVLNHSVQIWLLNPNSCAMHHLRVGEAEPTVRGILSRCHDATPAICPSETIARQFPWEGRVVSQFW